MFSDNGSGRPTKNPLLLPGWDFLYIVMGSADAPILRELALDTGPTVFYNSRFISTDRLEEPETIVLWLAPILHNLCCQLLEDSLKSPRSRRFTSGRWNGFRNTLCQHASMGWDQVIAATREEGIPWMADTLVEAALWESGFLDRGEGRGRAVSTGNGLQADNPERLA